jgi:hypothetical protein
MMARVWVSGGWLAALTVAAASTAVVGPTAAVVVALAGLGLLLVLCHSGARLAWFVVGGMAVFGGPDVGSIKLAYLAGLMLVATISTARVGSSKEPWMTPFRVIIPATAGVLLALACGLAVAYGQNDPTAMIRDGLPYAMLACAPLIALDAAHDIPAALLQRLCVLIGVIAAVGFLTDWLQRRGVTALPFGRLLLATAIMAAFGFAFALASLAAGQRGWYAAAAVLIPTLVLATGSRTQLVLAAAILGLLGRRKHNRWPPVRAAGAMLGLLASVWYLLPRLVSLVTTEPAFLDHRIQAALTVLRGGGAADGSYAVRSQSYHRAMEAWLAHPWFGTGPGHIYGQTFTLDTPVLVPAKFGVFGACMIGIFLVSILVAVSRSGRRWGVRPAHNGVRGFAVVVVAMTPFGAVIEDKGFAFAVCLGLCAVAAQARACAVEAEPAEDDGRSASDSDGVLMATAS